MERFPLSLSIICRKNILTGSVGSGDSRSLFLPAVAEEGAEPSGEGLSAVFARGLRTLASKEILSAVETYQPSQI